MASDRVSGPAWAHPGIRESAGIYPLAVEPAVQRLLGFLLPGIISTTTGARYYALHPLAWAEVERRGLEEDDGLEFVRRCEVVVAAACAACRKAGEHRDELPAAHGEEYLRAFTAEDGSLDLSAAAAPRGLSAAGFHGVYRAPERGVGVLASGWPPRPGDAVELDALRAGLGDVLILAPEDALSAAAQHQARHLCPCRAADSPDGEVVRYALFERNRDNEGARARQLSSAMMLDALVAASSADAPAAFRLTHGFGALPAGGELEGRVRRAWRATILRAYSVNAWRRLWQWISIQLADDELTVPELRARLAAAVGEGTVMGLLTDLPVRVESSGELVPAEETLRAIDDPGPREHIAQLAIGAQRLDDLDEETTDAYLGTARDDLGPAWVRDQLETHKSSSLALFSEELLDVMIRRAQRVALAKLSIDPDTGRPKLPTRLRDRDGRLWMTGVEGAGELGLRTWNLAQILAALGATERDENWIIRVTTLGAELRGRLR